MITNSCKKCNCLLVVDIVDICYNVLMTQHYDPDTNLTTVVDKHGKKTAYTEDEMKFFWEEERLWKEDLKATLPSTPLELAQVYPECVEILVDKVAQLDKDIQKLNEQETRIKARRGIRGKQVWQMLLLEIATEKASKIHQVEHAEDIIAAVKSKGRARTPKGMLSASQVSQAKAVPVTDYLKVRRDGKTNCIWHNEKTPSMHYYKKDNAVHCFGCGRGGDVVDVVQQLMGLDFKDAVRHLIKM
jgi:hypothetical protein